MTIKNTEAEKGPYGVFDELTEAALEDAVQKAVPVDDEQIGYIGNEPVFVLCQYLKGVCMPTDAVFEDYRPFVKQWFDLSEDKLIDEDGYNLTFAEVWAQLIEVWGKIKNPKGSALESAIMRAKRGTYKIPELDWCEDEKIIFLAKVCYELSRPDGDFFLTGVDAGSILDRTQKTGRTVLIMFQAEKIIVCTKKGYTGKASEYMYIGKPVIKNKPAGKIDKRRQNMIDDLRRAESEDNTSND